MSERTLLKPERANARRVETRHDSIRESSRRSHSPPGCNPAALLTLRGNSAAGLLWWFDPAEMNCRSARSTS